MDEKEKYEQLRKAAEEEQRKNPGNPGDKMFLEQLARDEAKQGSHGQTR